MTETYTFSRALHMMRYGGKKMKSSRWSNNVFLYVNAKGRACKSSRGNVYRYFELDVKKIIGSWEEVKNESN